MSTTLSQTAGGAGIETDVLVDLTSYTSTEVRSEAGVAVASKAVIENTAKESKTSKAAQDQLSKNQPSKKKRSKDSSQQKPKDSAKGIGIKNQKLGTLGEDLACRYLTSNEITILERNWKCKCGEADIIADEDDILVFIEVKTRSAGYLGLPEFAVTQQKRMRYEKIATSYLLQHQRPSGRVRFDVIAIQMTGEQQCLLRHHRDAFSAGY